MKTVYRYRNVLMQLLLLGMLLFPAAINAQGGLTGTKVIGTDYATLAAAISALNSNGVGTGGVIFQMAGGYTETFSSPTAGLINITTNRPTVDNQVLFQKTGGGANPLITAGVGTTTTVDGIIVIAGDDYITFDSIDLQESSGNTTTTTQMEFGYALVKRSSSAPFDGCQYVTIKNCTVTLNRTNTATVAVYTGNHISTATTSLTITATTDACNNLTVDNVVIRNAYSGVKLNGYSTNTYYDMGNTVKNCNIQNIGGSSAAMYGVYTIYQGNLAVTGNTVINDGSGGAANTGTTYGIMISTSTLASGYYTIIRNNTIQLNRGSSTSGMYGIYEAVSGDVTISSNTLQNFVAGGSSGTVYFINPAAANASLNIDTNTIQNSTSLNTTGSIAAIYNSITHTTTHNIRYNSIHDITRITGTSGAFYGYYNNSSPTGTVNFNNNSIYNINNSSGSGTCYGIYNNTTASQPVNAHRNDIYSFTNGTGSTYGLSFNYGSAITVDSNNVYGFTSAGSQYLLSFGSLATTPVCYGNVARSCSTSGASSVVYGIYAYCSSSGTGKWYNNKVYDLTASGSSTASVYGLYTAGGSALYFYNNFVSDLKTPASSNNIAVAGLYISGGTTIGAYYNTIYLNASSTSTTFGSSGVYATTTPTVDLRNNVVVNVSTPGGGALGAKTVAYRRSSSTLTSYSNNSNNNCWYINQALASKALYFDGTNGDSTISAMKTRLNPRDGSSFSENPPFLNVSTTPYNLHMNNSTPTSVESGATVISSPFAITDDIDKETRSGSTPDVGADEFPGTGQDIIGPSISYTTLGNGIVAANRSFTNVTITDASGVNTTSGTAPRVYFKKTTDANTYAGNTSTDNGWKWKEANGTTSPFDFTIDYSLLQAGVAVNDTIQYFVIAQDLVGTPNVGINGAGLNTNPTSVSLSAGNFPASSANIYKIVNSISGSYNVGTGQTYTTLTANDAAGFFNLVNNSVVTGNLTINIVSDITETGAVALNQISEYGAGGYTMTIQPDAAVTRTLSGSYAGGLIRLNGADRIVIDGRYSGSGNYLSFTNNSTSGSAVLQLISLGAGQGATNNTIRNCTFTAGAISTTGIYDIYMGAATLGSAADDNDNNSIMNNQFNKAYYGLYAYSGTATSDNLVVSGNTFGSTEGTLQLGYTGMYLSGCPTASVSQNTVQNIIGTVTNPRGIAININCTNATLSRNSIHGIKYTGTTGYGGKGIELASSSSSNITVSNNLIYDISGDGYSGTSDNIMGIKISAGGGYNLYYNSVNLFGSISRSSATADISAALFVLSGVSGIVAKDNIFANSLENTTGTAVAYAVYCGGTNPFTTINYNDYYGSGAEGSLGYLSSDCATLSAWQTATGQDANSIAADPQYNSTTNLIPLTGSPVLAAGTPIVGIAIDYTGFARSETTPSMGAYETAADLAGPAISYTALANTTSTSNRTLTATITDATGVNTTAGTAPRIYYKKKTSDNTFVGNTSTDNGWKWTESTTGSSPFTFTLDYSILLGGSVAVGDTIQYFVIAQDVVGTPNVSTQVATLSSSASSVVLGAGNFPATGSIKSYSIQGTITGTFQVGASRTYTNLTSALATYNNSIQTGAVTFELANDYSSSGETFPLTILANTGSSETNTLTIKPASGVTATISGSGTPSIFKISGADYFTLNGSNAKSATRNLTIANTNAVTSTAVIWMGSPSASDAASHNTIKNCVISGASTTTTNYGIFLGSTAAATPGTAGLTPNSFNLFENNLMKTSQYAIYLSSNTSATRDSANDIKDNNIGTSVSGEAFNSSAVYLANQSGVFVQGNDIMNVRSASGSDMAGLYLATTRFATVKNNKVHYCAYTSTSTTKLSGIYQTGSFSSSSVSQNTYYNNVVYDLNSTNTSTYYSVSGINTNGGYGDMYYFNSVYISGQLGSGSGARSFAFSNGNYLSTSTASNLDIRNNSFMIKPVLAGGTYAYAHYTDGANTNYATLNYNLLYAAVSSGTGTAAVGYLSSSRADLAAWQTATGQEGNSISADPQYADSVNLRPTSGSPLYHAGTNIAGITTDFLGVTRDGATPTIGAYEETGEFTPPVITYTTLANTTSTSNRTLTSVTITDNTAVNTTSGTNPRIYYKKSTDANVFGGNTSTDNGWKWTQTSDVSTPFSFTIDYSIINGGSVTTDDVVQYFVVAQDVATPANVSANPGTGFVGTSVSAITSAPTSPNSYKIVGAPLSGSYTVGSAKFNEVTGRNLYVGKVVKTFYKDVPKVQEQSVKKAATDIEEAPIKESPTQVFEAAGVQNLNMERKLVTEEVDVLMENGVEYTGELYAPITGESGTEGVYATLTAAVTAYNERGIGGATTFLLTDTTYSSETYPIVIQTSGTLPTGTNTLTIRPQTSNAATFSTSISSGLIHIYDPYVTLDGSNSGGTDRSMTFENTATSASSYILALLNDGAGHVAKNVTLKNMTLKGGGSTSNTQYGIILSASNGDYDNITITNNKIYKIYYGIQFAGVSGGISNDGVISNNTIGDALDAQALNYRGITVSYSDNLTIQNNEIFGADSGLANTYQAGVYLSTASTNTKVLANRIHDFYYTGTSGYGVYGIYYGSDTTSYTLIANNMIYNLMADGDMSSPNYFPSGVYVYSGGKVRIYNNSIYLAGNCLGRGTSYNGGSAPITVYSSVVQLDVRNNLLLNAMGSYPGSTMSNKTYGIYSLSAPTSFTAADYNDYYVNGVSPYIGYISSTSYATLAAWKTALGKETSAQNISVTTTSSTDLHLSGGSIGSGYLAGVTLSGITTDFDGDTRNTDAPYMGCDENVLPAGCRLTFSALIEGEYDENTNTMIPDTVKVNVRNATTPWASVDSAYVRLNSSGQGTLVFRGAAVSSTSYFYQVRGRNMIETWSAAAYPFASNVASYDFTTDASQAYGSNQVLKGTEWCVYSGDVNRDGFVDFTDLVAIDNDSYNYVSGWVDTDLNGDEFVDFTDLVMCDNNSYNYVGIAWPGLKSSAKNTRGHFFPNAKPVKVPYRLPIGE